MSFGRIALAWVGVSLWLVVVDMVTRRWATGELDAIRARGPLGLTLLDGALITLFGALWFASLGSGAWWLVFGLLGLVVGVESRKSKVERLVESRESRAETAVESRKSEVADSLSGGHSGAQPRSTDFRLSTSGSFRLSTFDFLRGTALAVVRYLGSGLILSLVL